MHKQQCFTLSSIDLDQFYPQGAIILKNNEDKVVLGLGKELVGESKDSVVFERWDFFAKQKEIYCPEIIVKASREDFIDYLKIKLPSNKTGSFEKNVLNSLDDVYQEDFKNYHQKILNHELEKIVLKSRQFYQLSENIPQLIYLFLQEDYGHIYGMWNEEYGYIGLSPEVLLSGKENNYSTMALAGTREISKREELLSDPKEKDEHNFVIKDIERKLDGMNLEIGELHLVDFNSFSHLRTLINFKSEEPTEVLIHKLTPTAALGGYPSSTALNMLKNSKYNNSIDQTYFGGVMGIQESDEFFFVVAIRNLQWNQKEAWIESGTGIVSDSILENELNEVGLKRKSIERIIFN